MKFARSLLLVIVLLGTASAERVSLESFASGLDTVPIAILPFRSTDGSVINDDLPWQVVGDDLNFSGRFAVTRTDHVDTALFREKGIAIYIDGEYSTVNGVVSLDCYVHDATTQDLLMGKKFKGEPKVLRSMSHRFSNQIVETLFGDKGIFETRVVFVKYENGRKNLWLADFDGRSQRQITNTNTVNVFPAFVDSGTIIWTSFLRGKPDLYKGSLGGGKSQIFIFSRYVQTSPSVSSVVGKISFGSSKSGNMEIYTCNFDGSDQNQITYTKSINTSPCWSPNGYQIAFTSDRSGQPQIYVMDADGSNVHRVTFEGRYQDSPAWSPKGDLIAYSSLGPAGKFEICVVKPDGTGSRLLTSNPGNNAYPAWSSDGRHIMFASSWGGKSDLWVVRADGGGLRRITNSGNAEMPDWSHF